MMHKKLILIFILSLITTNLAYANFCEDILKKELTAKPKLEHGHHIHNEIQVEINKKPEDIKIWFDNLAPEKIIKGTELVSGVKSTCLLSKEKWGEIGSRRLVYKNSGSSFQEEVLGNSPQKYFHYIMWDFSKDITHAIKYIKASFEIKKINENKSTLIWHVAFRPSNFIYNLPISIYLKTSFKPFMEKSLNDIKHHIESFQG